MNKTVKLGKVKRYDKDRYMTIYCKIEITDKQNRDILEKRLSISGVEGPFTNGNCAGSCGQIQSNYQTAAEVKTIKPAINWTTAKLKKFFKVWNEWHLNDMNAGCGHQQQLDTGKDITTYFFRLRRDVSEEKRLREKAVVKAFENGDTLEPQPKDVFIARLPYEVSTHLAALPKQLQKYYEPRKPLYEGGGGASKTEKAGWVNFEKHPEGLLSKPCDVCGYKYGSAWLYRELPQDIIEYLESLPASHTKPAWV